MEKSVTKQWSREHEELLGESAQKQRKGYCACECGTTLLLIDVRGRSRRYLNGHNARGKHNVVWKGVRTDKNGYRYRWLAPQTYQLEHRWVMEQALGRKLCSNEQVHHRNGNKHDNSMANLQVMSTTDHLRFHQRGKISSSETRRKISCALHGRRKSLETRARMSFARRHRETIQKEQPCLA